MTESDEIISEITNIIKGVNISFEFIQFDISSPISEQSMEA